MLQAASRAILRQLPYIVCSGPYSLRLSFTWIYEGSSHVTALKSSIFELIGAIFLQVLLQAYGIQSWLLGIPHDISVQPSQRHIFISHSMLTAQSVNQVAYIQYVHNYKYIHSPSRLVSNVRKSLRGFRVISPNVVSPKLKFFRVRKCN